jgi:hypothetical protein
MTVKNEETGQEINLKDLPFDLLEDYVMTNIDGENILKYFEPEDFQKDLSPKEILDLIYENIGYFNTSQINELSKEVTYYSKDRILPNNNIMDQFKSDFIINNWERLTLNKLEGLLNE